VPRSASRAAIVLALLGTVFVGVGATGLWMGTAIPDRIAALLPPEALIDAAGVGGATVALGALAGAVGVAHLALVPLVRRSVGVALIGGLMLTATLAVIALASAVAALVTVASGLGPAAIFVPVAMGLGCLAGAYAWLTAVLIGLRSEVRGAN